MITALARRLVIALLRHLHDGQLTVVEPAGRWRFGPPDAALRATVTLHDAGVWRALLRSSVGLGESYADGRWDADDLTHLIRIGARNTDKLDNLRRRLSVATRPAQWLRRARANSPARAKRQISAHYDLGNRLFELMLDERMLYSCAVFESPEASLEAAQVAKLELICDKLDLGPDDHLLEIGSGWGALAIHAAAHYGCRVTTTTISEEQHALATERVRAAGLAERVTVLLEDYRALHGRYDKLVSIEMIEAVGWRNFDRYFACCSELLTDDGLMLVQAIITDERAYELEKVSTTYMNTFIFPGGCLPSVEVMARCVRRNTDLRWLDLEEIGSHYVPTLRHWRSRFLAAEAELEGLGYDRRFRRLWELYLAYCEAGFAERRIGDVQVVLAKPGYRPRTASTRTRRGPATASVADVSGAGGD